MSGLKHAERFQDLVVYAKARQLTQEVFRLSKYFPKEEAYSLTDQIRRCSRSIGAQIAEAWGKRAYQRSFVSKLTDADAEQLETQHWVDVAFTCEYISANEAASLLAILAEIGRMLHSMKCKADQFCGPMPPTPATSDTDD
jgi:four helix bundle protein